MPGASKVPVICCKSQRKKTTFSESDTIDQCCHQDLFFKTKTKTQDLGFKTKTKTFYARPRPRPFTQDLFQDFIFKYIYYARPIKQCQIKRHGIKLQPTA